MKNNDFLNNLQRAADDTLVRTENGAVARKTTTNYVYDFFALGGAMRHRSEEDILELFIKAFSEDELDALKVLFYLGAVRVGQGERRMFRTCFRWLAKNETFLASNLMHLIPEYRRWDDVIYSCADTPVERDMLFMIANQLEDDMREEHPSLLAKWMPSINASSAETKRMARKIIKYLGWSEKQYRKTLSTLRERIKIVEKLMSEKRWDEINFAQVPSNAGFRYAHCFDTREETQARYREFISNKNTTVKANTLYPYDIAKQVFSRSNPPEIINKYWEALPDYTSNSGKTALCVVDTSGSMTVNNCTPLAVAISLGVYCAERAKGAFKDKVISFSSEPQFLDLSCCYSAYDKIDYIRQHSLVDDTNLEAVFDLLLSAALQSNKESMPDSIIVISDMQINAGCCNCRYEETEREAAQKISTDMERMRKKWQQYGVKMPRLIYWNVNASRNTFLEVDDVTLVSGSSPILLQQVLGDKTGIDIMYEIINSGDFDAVETAWEDSTW